MILYYILYFLLIVYISTISLRTYHMLQQNLYNENNRYLKWVWKNKNLIYKNFDLLAIVISIILLCLTDKSYKDISLVLIMCVYVVSFFKFKQSKKLEQNKKPLVVTKRIRRLMVTTTILYLTPIVVSIFVNNLSNQCLLVLSIMTSLNFLVIFIALLINHPIERMIYHYYEHQAKSKLKNMPNLNNWYYW